MSALKSAVMVNIQSHTRTVFEFPRVGIIRFHGNNSNGKSVLVKVLNDVISNAITRPGNRRSIIRRGHSYGELLLTSYDDTTLFIRIAEEAASTYAELTRPGCPPVRRYLADKSIPILVKDFGWHYDSNSAVSLNIHQDVDGFLFVDTKKSVNFDLLNSVRSDQFAEASVDSLEKLHKASKQSRTDVLHTYEVAQATFLALKYWDVEAEQTVRDTALFLAQNLEALDIPELPNIHPVPDVTILPEIAAMPEVRPVPKVTIVPEVSVMPGVRYPDFLPMFADPLPDIAQVAYEYQELKSGTCPTCKRPLTVEVSV